MPSQEDIFQKKKAFIEQLTKKLDGTFSSLADQLARTIIEEFADRLERDGNTILNTPKNMQLIAAIENIYNTFSANNLPSVATQIVSGADNIHSYNVDYFAKFDSNQRDYQTTTQKVQRIIRDRLGISNDAGKKVNLKPGGYMDSLLKDNSVKNDLKNLSYREVMKQTGFKDFKKAIETFIVGDEQTLGGFRQFYRNYAYDIFVDIDRHEGTMIATDIDLKYFVYEGTLIDRSRPFCIKRAGKVFSIKEADKWVEDPWIKKNLKKGYISSYNPTQDMGLFACRHLPRFVSEAVAKQLRPDLNSVK